MQWYQLTRDYGPHGRLYTWDINYIEAATFPLKCGTWGVDVDACPGHYGKIIWQCKVPRDKTCDSVCFVFSSHTLVCFAFKWLSTE
jgi:hypothetical protein